MQFNKEQLEAINHKDGACVVIAGAGSGKTTVLTNRIKNLIDTYGIKQSDIAAISFTNQTATQLEEKLKTMGYPKVNVGTFHRICSQVLGKECLMSSNSIKEWEYENEFKKIHKKPKTKDILAFISYQKNSNLTYDDDVIVTTNKHTRKELISFYKAYEKMRIKKNVLEYDDLLVECSKVNKGSKYTFKYLLVDEHQDCNIIKNILIKQFCPSGNIFVVGDYRQCIYGFTGSQPSQFMYFHKEWDNTKIINLDTNYRSTFNLVENADKFIKSYYSDYELYSSSKSNSKDISNIEFFSHIDKDDEAEKVSNRISELLKNGENPEEIAVLFRLNSHSIKLEACLRDMDINYEIANNGSFFKRREIEMIMSFLRLIVNPHDDGAMNIIFKEKPHVLKFFSEDIFDKIKEFSALKHTSFFESLTSIRYQKDWQTENAEIFVKYIQHLRLRQAKKVSIKTLIDNIVQLFKIEEYLEKRYEENEVEDRLKAIDTLKTFIKGDNLETFIEYIYKVNTKKKKDGTIKLMSVHKSKGLEFKHVFVISIEDGKFPHEKSDVLEEARLFYVAITRAKENLYLSQIGEGNRFVDEYFKDNI